MSVGQAGSWGEAVSDQLSDIVKRGQWRAPRPFDGDGIRGELGPQPCGIPSAGSDVVAYASNDYLGLSVHPAVIEAAIEATRRWGTGSGGSRYITGSRPIHHQLQEALAAWKHTDRAVLFPTGYMANLGVVATFGRMCDVVVSDELNHASIVDACRLARVQVRTYPHSDVAGLRGVLSELTGLLTMVVSDHVFSMDGDVAPIDALVECCREHGSLLVLDEAHSVLTPSIEELLVGTDCVRVGTLSKALGSMGGFAALSTSMADLLENRARTAIFSTALSPAASASALAALDVLRSAEGGDLVRRLRSYVDRIVAAHPSPIIPLIVGGEGAAVEASARLLEAGLWVPAIRPPTVPPGTSRLRITLSAAHTPEEIDLLVDVLASLDLAPRGSS